MIMHRLRLLCRGLAFFLILILMSVNLTGCAFLAALGPLLAALGPVLNALGAVGGMVGAVVGIFNPAAGQKISEVSSAVSAAGQNTSSIAQQIPQQTPNGTTDIPTARSSATTSEDGTLVSPSNSSVAGTSMTSTGQPTSPTTTSSTSVNSGGAASTNAQAMMSSGFLSRGTKAFDGRLNITQYAGPSDRTKDANTKAGLGNRNNRLRSSSLALSPDLITRYGLKGGESISIQTPQGTRYLGTYDDTTGNKVEPNVIDIYDPTDSLGSDNFMGNIKGNWQLIVGR
ncbi:MAG: hypothetical protein WA705_13505 [Candidatus Ozemobacteraceae bacterium]